MKKLGFILGNLLFLSLVEAEVRGDPRVDSIASVSRSFKMFETKLGRKPTTWGDLVDSGYLADPVLASAEKNINLRENYLIFDKVVKIDAYGRIQTVLVMSKVPTLEGEMSRSLKDGSIVRVPGRYLIVETASKEIQTAKYSEDELRRMFRSGGYDLDKIISELLEKTNASSPRDSRGPGENGDDVEGVAADEPDRQNVPRDGSGDAGSTPARTSTESPGDRGDSSSPKDEKRRLWAAVILAVGILLLAAKSFRRNSPSQGQKEKE